MRQYLFRGRRADNGEWIEGYYAEIKEDCYILAPCVLGLLHVQVDPATVGQYIDKDDKNGSKIFDTDIVKIKGGDILLVSWNKKFSSFCITKEGWMFTHFFGEGCENEDVEVIGNIHTTPELLK